MSRAAQDIIKSTPHNVISTQLKADIAASVKKAANALRPHVVAKGFAPPDSYITGWIVGRLDEIKADFLKNGIKDNRHA